MHKEINRDLEKSLAVVTTACKMLQQKQFPEPIY